MIPPRVTMDRRWAISQWTSTGFLAGGSRPGGGDPAGDAFGLEGPRAELSRHPIDLPEVAGNVCPALPAVGFPRAGLVNSVGPVGPSPHAEKTLEPLEHMVHTQTGPAGQFAATETPCPSDCCPIAPVGPYVAGGPVGPDFYFYYYYYT